MRVELNEILNLISLANHTATILEDQSIVFYQLGEKEHF